MAYGGHFLQRNHKGNEGSTKKFKNVGPGAVKLQMDPIRCFGVYLAP